MNALLGELHASGPPQPKAADVANLAARQTRVCAAVVIGFRCLRKPAVYHMGEIIQARLSFRRQNRFAYDVIGSPEPRRSHLPMEEIISVEPEAGTIDPFSRTSNIYAGSTLGGGWQGDKPLVRDLDVNEWIQFQRPGRYVLCVVSHRIFPTALRGQKPPQPPRPCELKSNDEAVEILAPDPQWEAAELAKIVSLLGSESGIDHFQGAKELRYLNTPAAAAALAEWYVRLPNGSVNDELREGLFESRYGDIVQAQLEKFLRPGVVLPERMADTLAKLELRREFADRPVPVERAASEAWSREYWQRYDSLKKKYSAAAGHPLR